MGLRCLIGHDYGDPLTEEEREERGDEVVVTVHEYRECTRCGHRRTVSENTEVRTRAPAPDPEPAGEPAPRADDDIETAVGGASDLEDVSASEDDGVILEDEPEETRAPGQWPGADDADDDESADEVEHEEWPAAGGEDEGFDAEPDDGAPASDVAFGGGLTPESEGGAEVIDAEDDEAVVTATPEASGSADEEGRGPSGIRSASPGPEPTGQQRAGDVETEFVCPECDHTAPSTGSSLRPGDICPECQRGYLAERPRSEDGRNP